MRWQKDCPGEYRSECGRWAMFRIEGVYPAAWNVDWSTDFSYDHKWTDDAWDHAFDFDTIVDGAASMKVARELFQEWFEANAAALDACEAGDPDWRHFN